MSTYADYLELARGIRAALTSTGINYDTPGGDRDALSAVFLGRAIATQLQLPTTPVLSPLSYYQEAHLLTVQSIVSAVNEGLVIDCTLVLDTVAQLFKLRYDMVYNGSVFTAFTNVITTAYPHVLPERITMALAFMNTAVEQYGLFQYLSVDRAVQLALPLSVAPAELIIPPVG